MALPTVTMLAPAPFWTGQAYSGTVYVANSLGVVSAASNDVPSLLAAGCVYGIQRGATYNTPGAPAAANSSVTITAATLVAGVTLTIAAQPDVPRQLAMVCTTGTATLTAGSVIVTYTANDFTTQVDTLNFGAALVGGGSVTLNTSKGVNHVTSAIVGATVTGGTGPTVIFGTTNYLAVPLEPGFVSWAIAKETKVTPTNGTLGLIVPADETISTTTVSTGMVSPTTAPDGTHQFSIGYTYTMPA